MASVIRVSILGSMPGGEVWSVNPCFFLLNEPTAVSSAQALTIANAVNAIVIPTGLRALMNSTVLFTGTRVEARHRDGTLEAQAEAPRTTNVTGTGAQAHPYQTSSVTSLRTGFPGAQGRGRLYWPATGSTILGATLRIDTPVVGAAVTGVRTYLSAIESAVAVTAGPNHLSVWSRTGSAFHNVTELRQGDIADTQRRRRDALVEAYTALSYPT